MPRTRVPLSRDRVLRTALTMVDEGGLEALSMRKLAAKLNVDAMSLYNHVENKDDIVAGILGLVAGEIELPEHVLDWRAALRARTVASYQMFVRRPWAARIWMSGPSSVSLDRLAQSDAVLRCLREAGLSPTTIYSAYHALDGFALGYAMQRLDFPYGRRELQRLAKDFLKDFPVDTYPDFTEHVHQHLDPAFADADSFEFGLDLILDGLDRLRVDAPRKRRPPRS
jgi:AcrR family transcriptional regulator